MFIINWIFDNTPFWVWVVVVLAALAATYPWWAPIWALLPNWLKATLIAVGVALAAYFAGRNRGSQDEKQRQKDAEAEAVKRRSDTNAQVSNLDPAQRDRDFNKWLRDK